MYSESVASNSCGVSPVDSFDDSNVSKISEAFEPVGLSNETVVSSGYAGIFEAFLLLHAVYDKSKSIKAIAKAVFLVIFIYTSKILAK